MNYKVAFFTKQFSERGTEKTTYDYADFNETILGNNSFIISFSELAIEKYGFEKTKQYILDKYESRFKVYRIDNLLEIYNIFKANNISHFYTQSHGFHRDIFEFNNKLIWGNCKTIYHCAFGPMAMQGSYKRCIVGEYLNERFKKKLPVLPPIVRKYIKKENLRFELKIPKGSIVLGRHGGKDTFDINFVKEAISELLTKNKNYYFIFVNTKFFLDHPNIIYLENLKDEKISSFIETCDAMIHARADGETFGLAPAEFSAANKPVITFGLSKDKEHLKILKGNALIYKNKSELIKIFYDLPKIIKLKRDWNSYSYYEPHNIMKIFEEVCLKLDKKTNFQKLVVFLCDLPWEIKIKLDYFIEILKIVIRKIVKIFNFID